MEHMDHGGSHAAPLALILLLVILPLTLFVSYGVAAWRLRNAARWSGWRLASFAVGCAMIITAVLPPLATWAHQDLRGHMLQHLLLGMFGPLALVFGAPGTLLLRSVPRRGARRIMDFLRAPPIRFLIHPLTAAMLDIGGMYLLYLTPLFSISMSDPTWFVLLHLHFVISGYLFTWSIAGPDPAPHRPGRKVRLSVLFLATAAHAILGKLMFAGGFPHGTAFSVGEIQQAAQVMYYGGDLAEFLLIVAFFLAWFRQRSTLPEALMVEACSPALKREQV